MKLRILVTAFAVSAGLITTPAFSETKVEHGMAVFAAQKCSLCHSVAGKGNPKGALDAVGTKLKPGEIEQWIVAPAKMAAAAKAMRKPAMKAYPKLAEDDLESLVAYMASLKAK